LGVRGAAPDGPASVCFRPPGVLLSAHPEPGAFVATLTSATYLGDWMQYEVVADGLTICARGLAKEDLAVGATVFWSVPQEACFLVAA
ncbi:MAG: TOBE domain-containing protein, partial [Acetobacteraceae bacterium]